jgi:tRNA-dihydrouridine synthase
MLLQITSPPLRSLLLRCFGVTLCYTPMIDAQEYVQCEASARHTFLQTRQHLFTPHLISS